MTGSQRTTGKKFTWQFHNLSPTYSFFAYSNYSLIQNKCRKQIKCSGKYTNQLAWGKKKKAIKHN